MADAYFGHGQAHVLAENWKAAIASFTSYLRMNPSNRERLYTTHHNRGLAYKNLSEFQKGIDDFTTLILNYNGGPDVLFKRGALYAQIKQWAKAHADYSQVIETQGVDTFLLANALVKRAFISSTIGNIESEIEDLTRVISMNSAPNQCLETSYYNRAVAHARKKNWNNALVDYTSVINLKPEDNYLLALAHLARADMYGYLGRSVEQLTDLKVTDLRLIKQNNPLGQDPAMDSRIAAAEKILKQHNS